MSWFKSKPKASSSVSPTKTAVTSAAPSSTSSTSTNVATSDSKSSKSTNSTTATAAIATTITSSNSSVPQYIIDISLPSSQRWKQIADRYASIWRPITTALIEQYQTNQHSSDDGNDEDEDDGKGTDGHEDDDSKDEKTSDDMTTTDDTESTFKDTLCQKTLDGLRSSGASSIADDIIALATLSNIPLSDFMLLQLSYESRGCTSVIAMVNNTPVMARTLDWDLPQLRDITIEIDVCHGTTHLYRATTFAGYVGILTAMRPGAYGVAINYREGAADSELYTDGFAWPIGMAVRHMMDTIHDYQTAVKFLHRVPLMAPSYIICCGITPTDAQLITRSEISELQRQTIGTPPSSSARKETKSAKKASSSNSGTSNDSPLITYAPYIVQANLDHWITSKKLDVQDSLARSNACMAQLKRAPSSIPLADGIPLLWRMLCQPCIWDDQTIYGTIMCPSSGVYTTLIDAPYPPSSSSSSSKQSKRSTRNKR